MQELRKILNKATFLVLMHNFDERIRLAFMSYSVI